MSTSLAQYTIKPIIKKEGDDKQVLNIPVISDNSKIVDSRLLKDFKDQTFGGYKLAQASNALDKALIEDKIDNESITAFKSLKFALSILFVNAANIY